MFSLCVFFMFSLYVLWQFYIHIHFCICIYMFLHFSLCLLPLEHLASWSAPTGASREAPETTWKAPVAQSSAFAQEWKNDRNRRKNLTTCVCMVYNLCFFWNRSVTSFFIGFQCWTLCFKTFTNKKNLRKLHQHRKKLCQRRHDKAPNRPLWLRYIHYTLVE